MNENMRIMATKVELTLEQSQQGVSDDVLAVNKSPTYYPCDFSRTFRVILFGIHSDEWKSFQSQPQTALRLILAGSDSLPHIHAQITKTYYKHQDLRIKKAQEFKTKTFVNSDIQDLP
ncbi:hypothetical protein Tco_0710146 [Tanacetum coccineum]